MIVYIIRIGELKEMGKTEAQKRANAKFEREAYSKVLLRLRNDTEPTRESITKAANSRGMSLNAYIVEAIDEKMQRDIEETEIKREQFFD